MTDCFKDYFLSVLWHVPTINCKYSNLHTSFLTYNIIMRLMAKLFSYFLPDEQERVKVSQGGDTVNGETSSVKRWKYDIHVQ